jgi:hypothetical protein
MGLQEGRNDERKEKKRKGGRKMIGNGTAKLVEYISKWKQIYN